MSVDGSTMIACAYGGNVWYSTNDGVSWTDTTNGLPSNTAWYSVAVSGSTMIACINGGDVWYSITSQPICFLSECDVFIDGYTYKNISEITESDSVIGCFSQKPERIVKVIKQSHLVTTLEETNHML